MNGVTKTEYGYRVTYEDGHGFEQVIGSGSTDLTVALMKVVWLNKNSSGKATVVQRQVVTGAWSEVSDG